MSEGGIQKRLQGLHWWQYATCSRDRVKSIRLRHVTVVFFYLLVGLLVSAAKLLWELASKWARRPSHGIRRDPGETPCFLQYAEWCFSFSNDDNSSASKEISRFLSNPEVHPRFHKSPSPGSIPNQINPVKKLAIYRLSIHFNIIVKSASRTSSSSHPFSFSIKHYAHDSRLSHPSLPPVVDRDNIIWRGKEWCRSSRRPVSFDSRATQLQSLWTRSLKYGSRRFSSGSNPGLPSFSQSVMAERFRLRSNTVSLVSIATVKWFRPLQVIFVNSRKHLP